MARPCAPSCPTQPLAARRSAARAPTATRPRAARAIAPRAPRRLSSGSSAEGLHYIAEKTVIAVSGANIKFGSDAALGTPATFLPCPTPHGISCAAANWRHCVLAFAEKGLSPAIYVHAFPNVKQCVAKLEGAATRARAPTLA